jgi:hypothetical protein
LLTIEQADLPAFSNKGGKTPSFGTFSLQWKKYSGSAECLHRNPKHLINAKQKEGCQNVPQITHDRLTGDGVRSNAL